MDGGGGNYGLERSSGDSRPLDDGDAFLRPDGHVRTLEEVEREAIRVALRLYQGNLSETARRLGIGRSTLYRRLIAMRADRG